MLNLLDNSTSYYLNNHFSLKENVAKKVSFARQKSDTFFVKKRTSFFSSKIAESHFFSVLESPAYISANRVGNFFYIEKRPFFQKNSAKFPTHFPDRYVGCQIFQEVRLLEHFCVQNSVQKNVHILFIFSCDKSFRMLFNINLI